MSFTQDQAAQQQGNSFRNGINVFYLLISGLATAFAVFFRRSFGGEAIGINAVAAIVIMLFFMMAYPQSGGLSLFFCLWWGALVLQRLGHFYRRLRGIGLHSQFDGITWLETLMPFIGSSLGRLFEVAFCLFIGTQIGARDAGLSQFFICGGIGLLLKFFADRHIDYMQVRQLNDATIEQQAMVARWRGGKL